MIRVLKESEGTNGVISYDDVGGKNIYDKALKLAIQCGLGKYITLKRFRPTRDIDPDEPEPNGIIEIESGDYEENNFSFLIFNYENSNNTIGYFINIYSYFEDEKLAKLASNFIKEFRKSASTIVPKNKYGDKYEISIRDFG